MTAVTEHPERRPAEPPLRPAWTLTGPETLTELDDLHITLTRLTARRLELLHHLDTLGHARDLGARDTPELLSLRHRLDPQQIRRDLHTAKALLDCPTVATQLPGYPTPAPTTAFTDAASGEAATGDTASAAAPHDARSADTSFDDTSLDDTASSNPASGDPAAGNAISGDVVAASDRGDDAVAVLVDRRRAAQASEVVLNPAQAAAIADALSKVPAHVPATDLVVAEMELVIAARTLLPKDLRRLGRAILDRLDTDGPPPADHTRGPDTAPAANANANANANVLDAFEAAHLAETLWWQPASVPNPVWASNPTAMPKRIQGLRFGGFITGENSELLQTLIDAAAKPRKTPPGELDPRTLGQRRADAFAIVLRAAAATGGEIPAHGGIKPHLSITVPYTTLSNLSGLALGTVAGSQTSVRSGPATSELIGLGSEPTISQPAIGHLTIGSGSIADPQSGLSSGPSSGSLVFGDPLPVSEVRRIACDAGIIPIVLGARGEPLDVGREQRLVTPAIRRALIARDGGCVIPGCGAPPGHCEAHHLIHWSSGGITAVSNLALVCPTHHRAIHRGIWIVTIVEGQVCLSRPPWTEPGPSG